MNLSKEVQEITTENIKEIVAKGHATTFTDFYMQFFKKLLIESNKYVKDIHVAEEIVQDVFLKIWEKAEDIKEIEFLKSYLYRSVINSSINYLNKQKSLAEHHQKIINSFTEDDLDSIDEENEMIVLLYVEIEKLPEKCKEVFKLNRFERLKYKEIAAKLNISERTVENHIANALKILRARMLDNKKSSSYINDLRVLRLLLFF